MNNTISFPGLLQHVFELDRTAFTVFGFPIQWYGVIIATGFVLAAIYVMRRAPKFGYTADHIIDLLLWALPISIIGARLYYVLNRWDYYRENPGEIIRTWEGGLAIYGGVIAAFLVVFFFTRKRKTNAPALLDIGCLGLLIGQSIGRWGNFVNAEAFGGETSLPWGMSINGSAPVHPTFLYESLWNALGFALLHFYSKKRRFNGEICLWYLAWYGFGRFFIEGLRTDSLYLGHTGIRISQALAAITCLLACGVLVYLYLTKKYKPVIAPAAQEEHHER